MKKLNDILFQHVKDWPPASPVPPKVTPNPIPGKGDNFCPNCMYAHNVAAGGGLYDRECRYNPPPWEYVEVDGWCGKFRTKK